MDRRHYRKRLAQDTNGLCINREAFVLLGDAINKTRTKCNAACTTFLKEGTGTPFRPSSMQFSTLTACKRYCKGWRYCLNVQKVLVILQTLSVAVVYPWH